MGTTLLPAADTGFAQTANREDAARWATTHVKATRRRDRIDAGDYERTRLGHRRGSAGWRMIIGWVSSQHWSVASLNARLCGL